jgi:GAF domain-containing protein
VTFAEQLHHSLDVLDRKYERTPAGNGNLEGILSEYLREVEAASDTELLTSILLLDENGERLLHGAAPSLSKAYCDAIHGIEIGPEVGSCGTAAFVGHSIYVTDIASDPLWADFKDLALAHDLRACWSTPIFNRAGGLIGTFAIYYRTPRAPLAEELDAIKAIGHRVAQAVEAHR